MEGLVPGRIVYYVFSEQSASWVNRRRVTTGSIRERFNANEWPKGAQAHVGNEVKAGDVYPAMVIKVWGASGCSNLKVFLDGSDDFWATSINFSEAVPVVQAPHTWHWMFQGQNTRYVPTAPPPLR